MDRIDVSCAKGTTINFGTRCSLILDTCSLRRTPHKIESQSFNVISTTDIAHKFVLKVNQVQEENSEDIRYELHVVFFCHEDDEDHEDLMCYFIISNKRGEILFCSEKLISFTGIRLVSDSNLVNWRFKCETQLLLNFYIVDHIPIFTKPEETTNTLKNVCFFEGTCNAIKDCTFVADISKLYMNSDLSDYKILAKGKTFNVHKAVLAARSTTFADHFKQNVSNKLGKLCDNDSAMTIDINSDIVEEMLRYIYTDSVDKLDELAIELYEVAKQFNLNGLQIKCVSNLIKNISADNVMNLLQFAKKHAIQNLFHEVVTFFKKNTNEVLSNSATDKFLKSFYSLDLSLENVDPPQE